MLRPGGQGGGSWCGARGAGCLAHGGNRPFVPQGPIFQPEVRTCPVLASLAVHCCWGIGDMEPGPAAPAPTPCPGPAPSTGYLLVLGSHLPPIASKPSLGSQRVCCGEGTEAGPCWPHLGILVSANYPGGMRAEQLAPALLSSLETWSLGAGASRKLWGLVASTPPVGTPPAWLWGHPRHAGPCRTPI